MKCPCCRSEQVRVIDTRKFDSCIKRIRECEACGTLWKTYEMAEHSITVFDTSGLKTPLNPAEFQQKN